MRAILHKIITLGLGEVIARLLNFFVIVLLGRTMGVEGLGIYALGQVISQNVISINDLGFKQIGARLVALHPGSVSLIISSVMKKRLLLTLFAIPVGLTYAVFGPVPPNARIISIILILTAIPNALTLEWVFWGLENYSFISLWKAFSAFLFVTFACLGILFGHDKLFYVAIANLVSTTAGAILLYLTAMQLDNVTSTEPSSDQINIIHRDAGWINSLWLGAATILNQIFHTSDTLLLSALASPYEVGNYSAAYKIMFLLFGAFYLIINALYPTIARQKSELSARYKISKYITALFIIGCVISTVGYLTSGFISNLIYGEKFANVEPILKILMLAVPFELAVTLLGATLVAWGLNKTVMMTTGIAAIFNVIANTYYIPLYGSIGAAWITLISYLVLLMVLMFVFYYPGLNRLFANSKTN